MKKLILFELNEVPYRVIDEFCQWRPQCCLARLLPRCAQFETFAEDRSHLSPWITWPTLHRGVVDTQHGIANFGQDLSEQDQEFPPVWSLVARQGISTGVFGSLHSYPLPEPAGDYSFYVPDTFAAGSECFPDKLSAFQRFNLSMVAASYRNVDRRIQWRPALGMLASLPGLGLRPKTIVDLGAQLVAERLQPWRRTRRRTAQVMLGFDVFMKQLCRSRPALVTFFTNHVASSMHRYWAAAFPGDYDNQAMDKRWSATYRNEIEYTMSRFDKMLARLVRFVERDGTYQLLVATSMGQSAVTPKPLTTQLYVTDVSRFMGALGVPVGHWEQRPAMAPDVNVRVSTDSAASLREALSAVTLGGELLDYSHETGGFFRIRLGQVDATEQITHVALSGRRIELTAAGMSHVEIDDRSGCTAYHIPEGSLLIYDPRDATTKPARTQASTLDIAPYILRNFGIAATPYMSRSNLTSKAA